MDIVKIREHLKRNTSPQLFTHSRGVADTAIQLALQHGLDSKKASLAGLLHDYAKGFSPEKLRRIALENSLADAVSLQEPALLHAPVGAWLLKRELGIDDAEILAAVRLHTTGAADMSLFASIIYLADCIEPGRAYPGVEEIRKAAFVDLEAALLGAVNSTIRSLLEREKLIHPNSVAFRNALLLSRLKNNQTLKNG